MLVATAIGAGGALLWLLDRLYATLTPVAGGPDLAPFLALIVVGAPVWFYRWWRLWPAGPGAPRQVWTALTSVAGLVTLVGAGISIAIGILVYLLTQTAPAGTHFDFLPAAISTGAVGALVWGHHRRRLGTERTEPIRAYQYAMAALGLIWAVGAATAAVVEPEIALNTTVVPSAVCGR